MTVATSIIPDLNAVIMDYGPWAVFALVLIEDFGVPVPGETALIAAAVLASQGKLPIALLLPAAWFGAVVGDNIGYAIGRHGGRRVVLRYGARWGLTDKRLASVERFFTRYGGAVVITARFVLGLRQLNGIVAGIGQMAAPRFMLYNASGAALWVMAWGFGSYWFGAHLKTMLDLLGRTGTYTLSGGIAICAGILLWWRYRGTRK